MRKSITKSGESLSKIVEDRQKFFRGPGSETRLFRRNAQIEQVLFGSHKLLFKRLRCLGGEIHDHKFLWQFSCEEWLQSEGIYPNPGTPPSRHHTEEKKQEREWKLRQWDQEIAKLEDEAKGYETY